MNQPEPEALAATYRSLSDEYLRERILSGVLTSTALDIAQRELRSRGVEVPELPQPVPEEPVLDVPDEDFVTIARVMIPVNAQILQGRLVAEGIRAVLGDLNIMQTYDLISTAIGGVKIRVPQSQVAEAKAILAAIHAGEFDINEE
jgi:hypothetical protein